MTKPNAPEGQKLRDLIAEVAADLSNENPFWTAKLLADALITRGIGIVAAQPVADAGGVTDADREAAAKCVEHGLSRPNPLNVRQGVVDSWHLVQAFARHRLQSVAAATAAKDAEIARLKGQFDRYFHEAANAQEEVERLQEGIERALRCTPSIQSERSQFHGIGDTHKIVYDCGNPWEILRAALSEAREARALANESAPR